MSDSVLYVKTKGSGDLVPIKLHDNGDGTYSLAGGAATALIVTDILSDSTAFKGADIAAIKAAVALIAGLDSTKVFAEQADTPVTMTAANPGETNVLNLTAAASTRYLIRSLRLKCADPGANTVTVRLYELVNDVLTAVADFAIDSTNFANHHSLMDMFGLTHLAGDQLRVTVGASAGGPYAITGQYSYAKTSA